VLLFPFHQFTILLVGYFVLGPSDLYKLVKEIGKFITNIRTLGTDLSTTFENNMESTLQLEELRKAQRELSDAFSFRRSINVDQESEAFSVQAGSAQQAEAAAATGSATAVVASGGTKKIRRRVRKRKATPATAEEGTVPDLEMPGAATAMQVDAMVGATKWKSDATTDEPAAVEASSSNGSAAKATTDQRFTAEEAAEIEAEFDQYTNMEEEDSDPLWYKSKKSMTTGASAASKPATTAAVATGMDPATERAAQSRFQQQLSGNWNTQILNQQDKLEPMAVLMNKIALLEEERLATVKRLEEEFQERQRLERKYYEEQRKLLEETASVIQAQAFGVEAEDNAVTAKETAASSAGSSKK
jgi:Sec-independent protein translocase protein TatA